MTHNHSKPKTGALAGITLAELVVSTVVLSLVMLGTVGFTANFMDVSFRNSKQMVNVNQARDVSENMVKEIANAAYIYPAGITISLNTSDNNSFTINTNNSVAMLYRDTDGSSNYGFTAFFLQNNDGGGTDLCQFSEAPSYTWDDNTSPASGLLNFYGSSSKLISDIDSTNTSLSYILNYSNGLSDEILQGQIGGVDATDPNALIKGIDWQIAQDNVEEHTIKIKELSRNVPRFFE